MTGNEIRDARLRAGLSQAELARRMGTTQSAVARLERPDANPRIGTVERALEASGHKLFLAATRPGGVDETLIAGNLQLTPAQRLARFERAARSLRPLREAGARRRSERGPGA